MPFCQPGRVTCPPQVPTWSPPTASEREPPPSPTPGGRWRVSPRTSFLICRPDTCSLTLLLGQRARFPLTQIRRLSWCTRSLTSPPATERLQNTRSHQVRTWKQVRSGPEASPWKEPGPGTQETGLVFEVACFLRASRRNDLQTTALAFLRERSPMVSLLTEVCSSSHNLVSEHFPCSEDERLGR